MALINYLMIDKENGSISNLYDYVEVKKFSFRFE